jgi:hypothetical protein
MRRTRRASARDADMIGSARKSEGPSLYPPPIYGRVTFDMPSSDLRRS